MCMNLVRGIVQLQLLLLYIYPTYDIISWGVA